MVGRSRGNLLRWTKEEKGKKGELYGSAFITLIAKRFGSRIHARHVAGYKGQSGAK